MGDLAFVSKAAHEDFLRRGIRLFEVPARQLFTHNARGELKALDTAEHNRKELARMALAYKDCGTVVELKRSLKMDAEGHSMVYSAGCKLLFAVEFAGARADLVGFAVIMNHKDGNLEARHRTALQRSGVAVPAKSLFLELICASPRKGVATFLLLRLLSKLARTNAGILCNPTNQKARDLFAKHGYERVVAARDDLVYLSRARALDRADAYLALLPSHTVTSLMCTRGGVRDPRKTHWDCSSPR